LFLEIFVVNLAQVALFGDMWLTIFVSSIWLIGCWRELSSLILPVRRIRRGTLQHRPLDKSQYDWIYESCDRLASALGVPMPELFFHPDANPNIFLLYSITTPALVLTSGVLKKCSQGEITGLLAHELVHVKRKRVFKAVGLALLPDTCFLGANILRWVFIPYSSWLSVGLGGLLVALRQTFVGVGSQRLLKFLRDEEYAADEGAVKLTKDPATFIAAISGLNGDYKYTEAQEPLLPHPLLEKRIQKIQAMSRL
jgi:Zn-dependent protease with chaperone function